jgi:hypothetical protein
MVLKMTCFGIQLFPGKCVSFRLSSFVGVWVLWFFLLCSVPNSYARGPISVKIGTGEARVTILEGSAQIQSRNATWCPLKVGNSLQGGDEIKVDKNSRLEIRLSDKSSFRFAENSRFKIISINMDNEGHNRNAKINLALGKTWANINKTIGTGVPNYEMTSRNAVCGVRGTVYRMNVEESDSVLVRVYEGEVKVSAGSGMNEAKTNMGGPPRRMAGPTKVEGPRKVSMEEWTFLVKSMQQIQVGADGIAQNPESFSDEQDRDAWVDWNKERDTELGKETPDNRQNWFDN